MNVDPVLRYEAGLKVTGRAVFEAETPMAGLLYAALVESPIACGEVLAIDSAQARLMPGVCDVISYDEALSLQPSAATALIRDRIIHFAGQAVALVVANSLQAAQTAARAIHVRYQTRPAIAALDQALDQAYNPAMAGRITGKSHRGDPASAIAQAHLVVRKRYDTAVNNHHPMEPHAVVCAWQGDQVTVHTNTQAVFGTRAIIAHAFHMPQPKIRVIARFLGGGFGCKGQLWWPWMMLAMLAARRCSRPVRLELTRAQMFALVGRRQETRQELTLGFSKSGALCAIEHEVLAQTSTHAEYSDTTCGVSRWLYLCPNVRTAHSLVRTNEPHPIPMRAPGTAPGTFALESAMDEAAHALGIDPIALRLQNFADHDQDAGRPWSSNGLRECYRVGAERFAWSQRPVQGQGKDGRWRLGWGMATTCYPALRQPCKVLLRWHGDASVTAQCGTQDMGSGTYTALAQMVAEGLGIPVSQVTVELGDTELPEGPFSGGSQVTSSLVPAVDAACADLRHKILAMALADRRSEFFGHDERALVFREGALQSAQNNVSLRLSEVLGRYAPQGMQAEGAASGLPASQAYSAMGYGAVFVELGIDTDLGELRVRRIGAAFAAGRILNVHLAKSQFIGGLIGGMGMALFERTVTDRSSGRVLGANLSDYLIPVYADMPNFDIAMIDEHDPYLPGGLKGIGMLGTAGVQAAIANAVFNAVGQRVRHLPIRIEDLI